MKMEVSYKVSASRLARITASLIEKETATNRRFV